jgi:cation transport regulator ChaC
MTRYFAYGSNLCTGRLRRRVPSATKIGAARLDGYKLCFHKVSRDGSGKADASKTGIPDDHVWGVVFELDDSQKQILDEAEGLNEGYAEGTVKVVGEDGSIQQVRAYFAESTSIDPSLRPYSWYHRYVLEGARQHELPAEYIRACIENVISIPDPKPERDAKRRAIRC